MEEVTGRRYSLPSTSYWIERSLEN